MICCAARQVVANEFFDATGHFSQARCLPYPTLILGALSPEPPRFRDNCQSPQTPSHRALPHCRHASWHVSASVA